MLNSFVRKYFFIGLGLSMLLLFGLALFSYSKINKNTFLVEKTSSNPSPTAFLKQPEPLIDYSKYSFQSLKEKIYPPGQIKLGKILKKETLFTSYLFTYQTEGKTISGLANIPKASGKFPVIILLRGYADKNYYYSGLGTEKSANFLAENGFLTLSSDFLGYGYSDLEDEDILKARFYRPVEILSLLNSLESLSKADTGKIGLWAHSNGGQVALSVLEISNKNYPTSLWAPVSLPFPECILTYLGEEEEVGNIVKEKIDLFLKNNDPKDFSTADHLELIKNTAFIIHQGLWDELIKPSWTKDLIEKLKGFGNTVNYFSYEKENHNFNYSKTTGEILRQRDLEFFQEQLKTNP